MFAPGVGGGSPTRGRAQNQTPMPREGWASFWLQVSGG